MVRLVRLCILAVAVVTVAPLSAFAQGSIFGTVQNADLTVPPNGDISFVGFLDDTDEEIRIELSTGAGYDAGNWFDDFQNYLTEAPGNPYDYYFHSAATGQGFHLAKTIPNNSFQQENILLQVVSWPSQPTGLTARPLSGSSMLLTWDHVPGQTVHVYRRLATSTGSFFRIDDPTGSLANPGVADSFFVDINVDGVSSYDYLIIAEDGSGNYSPHSSISTGNSAAAIAPVLATIDPANGLALGGTDVTITGSGFDPAGVTVAVGAVNLTNVTVVSPYLITGTTQAATAGTVDVTVINDASGLASNTLTGAFTYEANTPPVLAAIGPQSVVEGQPLTFVASASDADGGFPVMTSSALPGSSTYTDNNDGTGTFDWTPTFQEAGVYNVTFYATDNVAPSLVDSEQVTITVTEAGNQPPVLATIGAQTTTENVALSFAVSSSDPDGTIPTINVLNVPTGATFTPDGAGGGTFDWTPTFAQAGSYQVTFIATDGAAADSEVVAITVNDAGNQTPVLASIGAQSTSEGVQLAFGVSASDPDETIPTLTASPLPGTATFTDNLDGTGTFDWTPTFSDAGSYDITFVATDGTAADSEVVTITVSDAGNQAPILATIGAQSTTENVALNFAVSSTDPDGTIPTVSANNLPTGATFTPDALGGGTFDWTPDFTQAGTYNVTFVATDGALADSEVVAITVNDAGNQAPVLASIGPRGTNEGVQLLFDVTATDPDATIPTLSATGLPGTATFTDNLDGSGTFDWTPAFADAGTYDVTFFATDGALVDSEVVTITVADAGNQAPILTAIGAQTTTEGTQLLIDVTSSDPDGTIPTVLANGLPGGATFVDNLDGTGTFDWTPEFTQAGSYNVTFVATDGALADSEVVAITVNDAGNQAPVLATIGAQTGTENILLSFSVSATDPEGTTPVVSAGNLPTGAVFTADGLGGGTFDWTPTFSQAGSYSVTFFATDAVDAALVDSEVVSITIADAGNQPPVLDSIGNKTISEGLPLVFNVTASDIDGTSPTLTTSALPSGATFADSANGTGSFAWTPGFLQAGSYPVTFYASDGVATDSEIVTITVNESGNQAPVIDSIGTVTVTEGDTAVIVVNATDPEGGTVFLSLNTALQHYTFVDSGNGVGVITYIPDYYDAGIDSLTVIAVDNGSPQLTGSRKGAIQTLELNQPPSILPRGPYSVEVGSVLQFTIVAGDSTDQNPLNLLFLSVVNPPANATFTDNGDKTGTFRFTPQTGQEGVDTVRFLAVDEGTPQLSSQISVEITVLATNQPPVLDPIGPQVLTEGQPITLNLSASDPDGTIPYFDHTKLPRNATFVDNGDGTAVFNWTPDYVQSGLHSVTFKALDGVATDKEVVLFQVADAGDQVPTFDTLVNPNIVEGTTFTGLIYASDPDTLPVTIGIVEGTEPPTFTFTDSGNGIASYTMSPDFTMSGVYIVGLWVSDGTLADTTDLIITIDEAGNQPPVIQPRADTSTTELIQLQFTMTATDVDGDIPQMTAGNMPTGAAYTDLGNGSGFFNWTPDAFTAGVYDVTFYARDTAGVANGGVLDIDSTVVQVTVLDTNRAPFVVEAVFNQRDTVVEGGSLVFVMHGLDPDSTTPSLRAVLEGTDSLATNMAFTDSGNGFGYLEFTPDFTQGSSPLPRRYNVSFQAIDELDNTLTSPVNTQLIRVYDVPQPPTITVIEGTDPVTLNEGSAWQSIVTGTDIDGPIDSIRLVSPPANASLIYASGTTTEINYILTFAPDFTQAGTYTLTLQAFDPTGQTTTVGIDFTVVDAGNQAPTIVNNPPETKGAYLGLDNEVIIQAEDRESDSIMFNVTGMAPNMTVSEDGAGSATILFTPDSSQLGATYDVTVEISDGTAATTMSISYQVGVFMRGDADVNSAYTLNDAVVIANFLYRSGGLPDPWQRCDVDLSGVVDAADLAYLINYLYNAGPRPPQ